MRKLLQLLTLKRRKTLLERPSISRIKFQNLQIYEQFVKGLRIGDFMKLWFVYHYKKVQALVPEGDASNERLDAEIREHTLA